MRRRLDSTVNPVNNSFDAHCLFSVRLCTCARTCKWNKTFHFHTGVMCLADRFELNLWKWFTTSSLLTLFSWTRQFTFLNLKYKILVFWVFCECSLQTALDILRSRDNVTVRDKVLKQRTKGWQLVLKMPDLLLQESFPNASINHNMFTSTNLVVI